MRATTRGKTRRSDAHERHEGSTEEDGGIASITSGEGITAADGLTYADGRGGGDAERDHVSEGDGVEGDLVAGERDGAEAADERCDHGEDADFGGELQGGGQAERDETTDALDIGLKRSFEESVSWRRSYQSR